MVKPTADMFIEQASNLAKVAAITLMEGDYGAGEKYLKEALASIQKAREANDVKR